LEADIVIILRANDGAFPFIHPDNALFKFFGQTEKDVLDEERRLFYVAVTRAAERLYILTESERESPFLKALVT
jgi:DNA helicase-4